jgi:hypothetical protein
MVLKVEPGKPQPAFFIPVGSGGGPIQTKDGASLRIVAGVVDKDGNPLGNLEDICEKSVAAWEAGFKKVGLTFDARVNRVIALLNVPVQCPQGLARFLAAK